MQDSKLFEFIRLDDCDKVRELLMKGANPTVPFRDGKTAIGYAVSQNKSHILEILLDFCREDLYFPEEMDEDSPSP